MQKISIRVPGLTLHEIDQELKNLNFEDRSDFLRKAAKYLLADLKAYRIITLQRLEDIDK